MIDSYNIELNGHFSIIHNLSFTYCFLAHKNIVLFFSARKWNLSLILKRKNKWMCLIFLYQTQGGVRVSQQTIINF